MLNIEEWIAYYTGDEPNLPEEVVKIAHQTREAARCGRSLEVLEGLRKLGRFHDGSPLRAT